MNCKRGMMQVDDLLKDYSAFHTYKRNGLDLELQFYKAEALPENVLDWAFTLCKSNMEAFTLYNASWGWHDDTKRSELGCAEARFIIAYTKVRHLPAMHSGAHAAIWVALSHSAAGIATALQVPAQVAALCFVRRLKSSGNKQCLQKQLQHTSAGRGRGAPACGFCAHAVGEGRYGGLACAVLLRHPAGALCAAQGPWQVHSSCSPSPSNSNTSQGARHGGLETVAVPAS